MGYGPFPSLLPSRKAVNGVLLSYYYICRPKVFLKFFMLAISVFFPSQLTTAVLIYPGLFLTLVGSWPKSQVFIEL